MNGPDKLYITILLRHTPVFVLLLAINENRSHTTISSSNAEAQLQLSMIRNMIRCIVISSNNHIIISNITYKVPYFNFLTVLYSLRSKIRNVKWQIWIIQLDCSLFGAETWNINSCVILSIKNDTTKFQPLARFKYWCWRRRLLLLCSRAVAPAAGCSAAGLQEATNHCRGHAALQQLGSGCPHSASSHRHTNMLLLFLHITSSHHIK